MWTTLTDDGSVTNHENDEERHHVQVEMNELDDSDREEQVHDLKEDLARLDSDDETERDIITEQIRELERPEPLSWCNHANIFLDESEDSVTVTISVGDPRGAFGMTIRRIPDDAEDKNIAGKLIMHLPHPGELQPHRDLTEDHPGTYWIS